MEIPEQIIRETLSKFFETTFKNLLPHILKELLINSGWVQDCIPIAEAMSRYDLSRQTLYNYHQRNEILYSSGGRTFVSVTKLEAHIKSNPLRKSYHPDT